MKRMVISGLVVLLVVALLGSFTLAMGKKPAVSEQSAVNSEQSIEAKGIQAEAKETSEVATEIAEEKRTQMIETKEIQPGFKRPIPKDKFVLVEIYITYYDKILEGKIISKKGEFVRLKDEPYYNKDKEVYGGVIIKPFFNHISIEGKTQPFTIIAHKSINEDTLLAINRFWGFRGERSSGGGSNHITINSLPFLFKNTSGMHFFTLNADDIYFIALKQDGSIKFNYGSREINLKSENSWEATKEIIEKFENKKGDIAKVKFTTKITIKNRGIMQKLKNIKAN